MVSGRGIGVGFDRKNRKRRQSRSLALLFLLFGAVLIWLALKPFDDIRRVSVNYQANADPLLDFRFLRGSLLYSFSEQSRRAIYPYSVVPGGVESAEELRNAVANDPVVAAHYQGFDLAKARVIRLNHARAVYVSYRKGNDVFWTSKRMSLLKGETVISDGGHMLRTRCGNQISEFPRVPVAPAVEPLSETLETPLYIEVTAPSEPPLVPPLINEIQPTPPEGEPGGIFIPPFVPIIVGGGGGHPVLSATSPPPTPAPEPATLVLFSTGLGAVWLVRNLRKN